MVRGQPKGHTKGIIRPRESLPLGLLRTQNARLIAQHEKLIELYLASVKRSAWWRREHSFATVGMYTAFFYRCLGNRVLEPQCLGVADLLTLYQESHGSDVQRSTLVEHCRRLTVLGTILHKLGILRGDDPRAHNHCVQDFFASRIALAKPPKNDTTSSSGHEKSLTEADVRRLYAACQTNTEHMFVLLLLTTGLRIGGVVNLRVSGLCDQSGEVGAEGLTSEKGGAQHRFFICPMLRDRIKQHMHCTGPTTFLFPSRYCSQDPCSVGHLQRLFGRLCRLANVSPPHNVHRTRHTLVHALRLNGTPAKHIQLMLGHRSSRTTDHYGGLCTNELVERMHLPWGGMNDDDKDRSSLLRSLCPVSRPWKEKADTMEHISVPELVRLLASVVKKTKTQPTPWARPG